MCRRIGQGDGQEARGTEQEAVMAHQASPGASAQPRLRLARDDAPASDYDALTELFLGPASRGGDARRSGEGEGSELPAVAATLPRGVTAPRPSPGDPEEVKIEGLILGHLPVMASAWGMQYARQLAARRGGPVAVLRLRLGEMSLELVGGGSMPSAQSLENAMEMAASRAQHWLVRVDAINEPMLADHEGLDAVTLLSSADEAAIVAAYRTVKGLFAPAEGEGSELGGGRLPEVRIALVGAVDERSEGARGKLMRAAATFLGRPVEVVNGPRRIGGGEAPAALLYRGAAPDLDDALELVARVGRQSSRADIVPAAAPGEGAEEAAGADLERELMRVMEEAVAQSGGGATAGAPRAPATDEPGTRRETEEPARRCATLAAHTGLVTLEARCPYAPGVELAVDDDGALHLLAEMGRPGCEALKQLLTASAWAVAHAMLLRAAAPGLTASRRPVLHLFTCDAREVQHLWDCDVRLHLLAPVMVGGQCGWYCGRLN
jgi:hypothetical protein